MTQQTLDETDLAILRALQEDCRLTTKELAGKIHLSTTPTFERLRRLERRDSSTNTWPYWMQKNWSVDSWSSATSR